MSGANSLAPSDDEGDDHDREHPHPHPHPHQSHRSKTETSHLAPPAQDLAEDGDDELSANPTEESKRSRPHHHHHLHHHPHHVHPLHSHLHPHSHPHTQHHTHTHNPHSHHRHTSSTTSQPHHRMANILGDGDDVSTRSGAQTPELSPEPQNGTDQSKTASLEEQQREDQSIQGSVY